jgi:hypothetical protein
MKKIIIILAVILTSGLTALSITRNGNKEVAVNAKIEKAEFSTKTMANSGSGNLATAD